MGVASVHNPSRRAMLRRRGEGHSDVQEPEEKGRQSVIKFLKDSLQISIEKSNFNLQK